MNKLPEHSKTADTLLPTDVPRTQSNLIISNRPEMGVERQQQATRAPIKAILGSWLAGLGALYMGAAYNYHWVPFNHSETANIPSASPSSSADKAPVKVKPPEHIETDADFKTLLNYYEIKASPEDFQKFASGNQYFNGLKFVFDEEQSDPSDQIKYHWEGLENKKFTSLKRNDIIVAVSVKAPRYEALVDTIGVKPKAKVTDQNTTYFYYRCIPTKGASIASVVIRDPQRPGRNLSLFPLQLPICIDDQPVPVETIPQ